MKPEAHLTKARRIEESVAKLDPARDWEVVIEGIYGAALHYIAYVADTKLGKHHDTHKGLPAFLDQNNLPGLAETFRALELLRQSRWYGGRENGEISKRALSMLGRIKEEGGL